MADLQKFFKLVIRKNLFPKFINNNIFFRYLNIKYLKDKSQNLKLTSIFCDNTVKKINVQGLFPVISSMATVCLPAK